MTKSLGVFVTMILVLGALGVGALAVYNATHSGDGKLTASLGGGFATLLGAVSLLWASKPGGLDAQAGAAVRDFAAATARVAQPTVVVSQAADSDTTATDAAAPAAGPQPFGPRAPGGLALIALAPSLLATLLLAACAGAPWIKAHGALGKAYCAGVTLTDKILDAAAAVFFSPWAGPTGTNSVQQLVDRGFSAEEAVCASVAAENVAEVPTVPTVKAVTMESTGQRLAPTIAFVPDIAAWKAAVLKASRAHPQHVAPAPALCLSDEVAHPRVHARCAVHAYKPSTK